MGRRLLLLCLIPFAAPLPAQNRFDLSVASIMRGPELVGVEPTAVRWSDDGRWVYFQWKPGGRPWHEDPATYRVASAGGTPEKLSPQTADSLGVLLAAGSETVDRTSRVVSHRGDLFIIDRRTLAVRRLTDTRTAETSPVFDRGGGTVYFVRDNNVFALELSSGTLRQLTDIRTGSAPATPRGAEGQRGFLEEQQRQLFEHIRLEAERRAEAEKRQKEDEAKLIQPAYIGDDRVTNLSLTRTGKFAALQAANPTNSARRTIIPDWVTRTGYTEPMEVRSKVGDAQGSLGRLGILTLGTGTVRWINVESALEPTDTAGRKSGQIFGSVRFAGWSDDGITGLIGALSTDFKDQWLYTLDAASGKLTLIAHEKNNAWIGGPCDFWSTCAGWLPDGRIYFASERDGYSHLYLANADGSNQRQLTSGSWEVQRVALSPNRDRFYITTNEGSPHEVHFYHLDFDGKARTRIISQPGRQDATPSPDGSRIAVVHSFANRPPELFLGDNRAGTQLRQVTDSPTPEWKSYKWIAPQIVKVKARDGVMVPARIYRPKDVGATAHGGAVIFVHGAGYLQNVHNWWSSYFREYMFHHVLASKGFTVLDIDYRGSAGYGRDWRTAIYRHMGGKDLTDQVDGVRYLAENEGVDAQRVGIYGGSYGGFITLMALFTEAPSFAAGAALRSVTDWAHYNHGYTGRILNLPHTDTLAYRQSSPIYFAEGLQDPLLIAHGMVDTNVHFSDVVRLAQRLIELGKKDWEMAVYPVEDHGFVEPSSWTDEYRRILELFERHLVKR
jgi:dipeptidyl aminopeptidase/acylaminoacyl peptidase